MAEARENLLTTLTNQRLGDVPAPREPVEEPVHQPVEPKEPSRDVARRPDAPADRESVTGMTEEEEESRILSQKLKVRGDDGETREITLKDAVKGGYLDKIVQTANQFPTIQQKYIQELERNKGADRVPAKAEPPPPPTAQQIRDAYTPMLQAAVKAGHMEADFAEAYPQHAAELMYFRDIVENAVEKLGHVIDWIAAESQLRDRTIVSMKLNSAIDALVAKANDKEGAIFLPLKEKENRDKFVQWVRTDVDPKVKQLTPEHMEHLYMAYLGPDILKFARQQADKPTATPKPRARSDGSTARPGGAPESAKEETLLDRMTASRLGPTQ